MNLKNNVELVPRAVLIPFGWSDYPQDILSQKVAESIDAVESAGVQVISARTILETADVIDARNVLKTNNFDFIIILIASWLDDVNVFSLLQDYFDVPILLWSHMPFFHEGEKITLGAMVGASIVRETFEEMDVNFKFIYGLPDSEKVIPQILCFAKAAHARRKLLFSRIGLFGYAAMGIYTATFDHVSLRRKIGPEIVQLDQFLIIDGMGKVDEKEVRELKETVKSSYKLPIEASKEDLDIVCRMYLSLYRLVKEYKLDAVTVKCHFELSKVFGATPCMPLSILGDQVISSCEGDVLLIVTQYLLHLLSGRPTTYGDIHEVSDNNILVGVCGFAPFSMCDNSKILISTWGFGGWKGLLNSSPLKEGEKVTLARLASKGDDYKLHFAVGSTTRMIPWREAGCPPFPGAEIILDKDVDDFAQKISANHYAMVYYELSKELKDFCKITSIREI
ncbi:MAG: hypothetical protein M1371_03265 [Actinobacteria bacterium]|nr:hypothetical protein [Actinomycetota bacterium]